jgi:hypothetical protein
MNMWTSVLPFPATSESFFWLLALAGVVASAIVLIASGARPAWATPRPSLPPVARPA